MAFTKKRKSKLDVASIVRAHSDNEALEPTLEQDAETPDQEKLDTVEALEGVKKAERTMKLNAELEAKYPHVIPGSIRLVPRSEQIGDTTSKGKVATIRCVEPDC